MRILSACPGFDPSAFALAPVTGGSKLIPVDSYGGNVFVADTEFAIRMQTLLLQLKPTAVANSAMLAPTLPSRAWTEAYRKAATLNSGALNYVIQSRSNEAIDS